MLATGAAAGPAPARDGEPAAAGSVLFRDTVSQPVPSLQRPGRVYHADDFAPGARRRPEPRPVAAPPTAAYFQRVEPPPAPPQPPLPAPAANGFPSHAAGGLGEHASNGAAGSSAEPLPQPAAMQRAPPPAASDAMPSVPYKAESAPAERPPRGKPPKPAPPAPRPKRPREQQPSPASQPPVTAPQPPPVAQLAAPVPPRGDAKGCEGPPVEGVWRSAESLAQCLACDICCEVLVDPVTSPTCMHCYCRECIDTFLVPGGASNCCPVCQRESVSTSLGQNPYKDHLKMDFVLESLIRKAPPPPPPLY